MIVWTSNVYVGKKMRNKKTNAVASINGSEVTFGVYCIAFASNPDNLFDIINANELLFPYYRNKETRIVGLAKGKEEAMKLVQTMLMEVYNRTGNFDVRSYFI